MELRTSPQPQRDDLKQEPLEQLELKTSQPENVQEELVTTEENDSVTEAQPNIKDIIRKLLKVFVTNAIAIIRVYFKYLVVATYIS